MHILLTTYGLIVIFALFCLAQWRQSEDMAYIDAAAKESFVAMRDDQLEKISDKSQEYYNTFRQEQKKDDEEDQELDEPLEKPDSLDDELDEEEEKPERRTSFLHVDAIFCEEEPDILQGRGKASFTLLKALISELYSGQDFFERAKESIPDLEEHFLHALLDKVKELKEEETLTSAKELASLNLDDDLQSYVRYKMLTGNKYRKKNAKVSDPGFYPLLEFVSFRKHPHLMSLWLAPKPLLMALFQNEDVVNEVVQARHEIYNELRRDKNKSALQTKEAELRRRFSMQIFGIDSQYIDFKVSRTLPKD